MRGILLTCGVATAMQQASQSPGAVQKVVNMLNDIKKETEAEGQSDKEGHDKMVCWCDTNRADKEESIEAAKQSIDSLTARIEEDKATIGKLETQLEELEKSRSENKDSLAQASEMREKANGEYEAAHADATKAIGQLKEAVATLESNFGADGSTLLQVASIVKHSSHKFQSALEKDYASMIDSLNLDDDVAAVQSESSMFGAMFGGKQGFMPTNVALNQQQGPGYKSYNAKSGKILGLLKQMQEGMEHEDEESTATEKAQAEAFAELKTTLKKEIATQTNKINDKTTALADTKVDLENSESDLEETQATLEADEKFLADLEETCTKADNEYDARVKERSEELQAVAETIGILTSDEARELFSSSGQFVQVQQTTSLKVQERVRMSRASALLKAAAQKSGSRALLGLSVSLKIHGLEKVKKAMEEMIANLKTEQAEEFEKKDHCDENINKNEDDTTEAKFQKKQEETKIQDLEVQISDLTDELAALEKDISETQTAVKRAGEDRGMASRLYQKVVAEQRATQKILEFALKKLDSFYNKKSLLSIAIHRSQAPGEAPPPPPTVGTHSKQEGGNGVLSLLNNIMSDLKLEMNEDKLAEEDAQQDYEKLSADATEKRAALSDSLAESESALADAHGDLLDLEGDKTAAVKDQGAAHETEMRLHAECDWLVANFETRKEAREGEIDALEKAKAVLSGADFSLIETRSFLAKRP
mmetsp:Transcript_26039/g.57523  ORF Transcript_26039/g.57523 Transcript_26039/m.57523 type:complete len:709 (+) Transcript_26039:910-3036(+)